MKSQLIQTSEEILSGTPVFYGTRVPVKNLIDYLSTGETIDAFLDDFPSVSREQVIMYLLESETVMVERFNENID